MTADEIHQLGLREIDRIQAKWTRIAKKEGFADLASSALLSKTNPNTIPTSAAEQLSMISASYIAQMERSLLSCSPSSEIASHSRGHTSLPAAAANPLRHRTPDGKRPGRVVARTSHFAVALA